MSIPKNINKLSKELDGSIHQDMAHLRAFATDASVYQQHPLAVAFPKSAADVKKLVEFASANRTSLIPRAAGTSLAGQVVGAGIVVDVSKHLNEILEINVTEKWARVQPGVIRDELNLALDKHGLFFAPETSTSNRATIGGMLGNNSCGANSIVYGTTRDHTISVTGTLSDGNEARFGPLSPDDLKTKSNSLDENLESQIYREIWQLISKKENRDEIHNGFPVARVARRNTGYALDSLVECEQFSPSAPPFNVSRLIAGSEGTLFFATEIKIQLHDLPPPTSGVLCAHFRSVQEALQATLIAMEHQPFGCELIDHHILEGAARNIEQRKNLDYIEGQPVAILLIQVRDFGETAVVSHLEKVRSSLNDRKLGYAYPILLGEKTNKVWALRKAGLGVVANTPSDSKPTTLIEDTAVSVERQPKYIAELSTLLAEEFGAECVHYGHAGAGELHLRPIMNLKTKLGRKQFRQIAESVATLVQCHGGSLSGEHGDGRLRGEFVEQMVGPKNFQLMREIKKLFDPNNIFNPGKIIDAPPMDSSLRYTDEDNGTAIETVFDFSESGGIGGAAEMCSGSGDCRKTELTGGTMCPSYMATRNEIDTTRARANVLRQVINEPGEDSPNRLASEELKNVMELCLSCKGCKSECPSNVDMAKLKAEFLQAYYDANGVPRRAKLVAGFEKTADRFRSAPWLYNWAITNGLTSSLIRRRAGFHKKRSLPRLANKTLRSWISRHRPHQNAGAKGEVDFFCDEFTNHIDVDVGIAAIEVLERLGYRVYIPEHIESGRAAISSGLLRDARDIAERNIKLLCNSELPLVGVEPSALLTLRDEYPDLVRGELKELALQLSKRAVLVDEFIDSITNLERPSAGTFTSEAQTIRLHGHCHQKAIASLAPTIRMLQLPDNYRVRIIPSGCCGMAGSFGFEEEHYDLSMRIGELVLFPTIRKEPTENLIAAAGTSCRHQILDGTSRIAQHPIQIIRDAMLDCHDDNRCLP